VERIVSSLLLILSDPSGDVTVISSGNAPVVRLSTRNRSVVFCDARVTNRSAPSRNRSWSLSSRTRTWSGRPVALSREIGIDDRRDVSVTRCPFGPRTLEVMFLISCRPAPSRYPAGDDSFRSVRFSAWRTVARLSRIVRSALSSQGELGSTTLAKPASWRRSDRRVSTSPGSEARPAVRSRTTGRPSRSSGLMVSKYPSTVAGMTAGLFCRPAMRASTSGAGGSHSSEVTTTTPRGSPGASRATRLSAARNRAALRAGGSSPSSRRLRSGSLTAAG
jgi:hypothetical protein